MAVGGVGLEVSKHVGEVSRILVHAQHPRAVLVDESNAARPEPLATRRRLAALSRAVRVNQERLESVADLTGQATGSRYMLEYRLDRVADLSGQATGLGYMLEYRLERVADLSGQGTGLGYMLEYRLDRVADLSGQDTGLR